MTGLADCDNFFVSCERTVDPSLQGKPVVILSNNDGCVIARSNEAKSLGIKMGVPRFEINGLVASGKVIALSGNHNLYSDISRRVHAIFRKYVPRTVDYSVDEAFLDMTGIPFDVIQGIGLSMRRECMEAEGIPVTIGFAATKVLAKLAVESIKRTETHVRCLTDQAEIDAILASLPAGELWGIGRRLRRKLYLEGVYSALDFASLPKEWIRQKLGVTGERLWLELHGTGCIDISYKTRHLQESISETRTFPFDCDDYAWTESRISIYAANCSRRLRAMHGECGSVGVFLQTNRFRTDMQRESPYVELALPERTDNTQILTRNAINGLRRIFRNGTAYKRAGVVFSSIRDKSAHTGSLFAVDSRGEKNCDSLMRTVDSVNGKIRKGTLKLASEMTWDPRPKDYGACISFGFRDE